MKTKIIVILIAIVCFTVFFVLGVILKGRQEDKLQKFYVCAEEKDVQPCYNVYKGLRNYQIN